MKFKNYKNTKTGNDKIYSDKNFANMTLSEIFNNREELIAQHKVLGFPNEAELAGSGNVVHVEAYTREDGTEVKAHWRSNPNSGSPDKISDVSLNMQNDEVKKSEKEEIKKQYIETENRKSIERNDPEEIAGVKRGEPVTFEEMMQRGVNPNYMNSYDEDEKYARNCQSCNVACELVIRGYSVEAAGYDNPIAEELSKNENSAYLDPVTGEKCIPQKIDLSTVDCADYIDETVKTGERYEFTYHITPDPDDYSSTESHIVFMTRLNDGKLLIYDGQNGEVAYGSDETKSYINSRINSDNTTFFPRVLRVDDKKINPYYANRVVRVSGRSLKH